MWNIYEKILCLFYAEKQIFSSYSIIFFEKKVAWGIAGMKKVRTFASAIENDTVAKQKVLWKILDKQTECSTSVTFYLYRCDEK